MVMVPVMPVIYIQQQPTLTDSSYLTAGLLSIFSKSIDDIQYRCRFKSIVDTDIDTLL